jgi:hypothetical protein
MIVFHVERFTKPLVRKGFFVFIAVLVSAVSCITPRHTVQIQDYTLLRNGKTVLGQQAGLTAFVFENNQRKIPFRQFLGDKYNLGNYTDVEYWVEVEGQRLKVLLYDNAELEKYFDTSVFMVSNVEPDMAIVGSKANFIAISVINSNNEDCLIDGSLYQKMAIQYLKNIKDEYNSN